MQLRLNTDIRVTVVGLGYVGLTLATALAREGFVVHGIDSSDDQLEAIRQGKPRFFEPGLSEALSRHLERNLFVGSRHGSAIPDVCIIAVSTPVDTETGKPDLSHLRAASDALAPHIGPDTLVIVRSTVPVGTTRNVVLPRLVAESNDGKVQLAFCPERTIQGQALRELQSLPQLIGAIDRTSAEMARDFFGRIARQVVVLESPESAELTKLANNAHTDVLYAFANELAIRAENHGLDPLEIIHAANFEYPRPDIAFPGFVGGGCLSKDPYLLIGAEDENEPKLLREARRTNESMPRHVAARLVETLVQTGRDPSSARILLCGVAYKGVPPTDDLRGNPAEPLMAAFGNRTQPFMAHDFMVGDDRLRKLGLEPVSLAEGFCDADAVVFLNNHRGYRELATILPALCSKAADPLVLFDCWRIFDRRPAGATGIAIETGQVGPTSWRLDETDLPISDPRDIPGLIYQSIGLVPCAHSSPAVPVS